eukprot:CAMPEP_0117420482 /NCGR_PEP_ID=MMETSP0758-20121206/1805_1 /TAXON_ID=63605 /ORGANISM="Percolomonas cosmopolitus, Strain AE-1 (ATCC 50343)" /LENGTH=99 /DNA_ID=CAMNT_0005202113 /DNA_START=1477 /DNA_END=1776 /DNA_ORIENTATION=-
MEVDTSNVPSGEIDRIEVYGTTAIGIDSLGTALLWGAVNDYFFDMSLDEYTSPTVIPSLSSITVKDLSISESGVVFIATNGSVFVSDLEKLLLWIMDYV